jgi:hypothetical protein
MDTIILMLKLLLVDNCYAARMIIYTRTWILKLFSWCATICNLTHSMFHQLLFYVRSHGVSSILPPFLCAFSRQTLRYFDGMNSLVVRVHVVFVSGFYFFIMFIRWFFLTKPVYHWPVAGEPLVVRVPQFEKPCSRTNFVPFGTSGTSHRPIDFGQVRNRNCLSSNHKNFYKSRSWSEAHSASYPMDTGDPFLG